MRAVDVSELEGAALNWAVARAVDHDVVLFNGRLLNPARRPNYRHNGWWQPSTDWSQGGPLIETYKVDLAPCLSGNWEADSMAVFNSAPAVSGPTPLIAACRAIVTAKLGRTVKVPEELL